MSKLIDFTTLTFGETLRHAACVSCFPLCYPCVCHKSTSPLMTLGIVGLVMSIIMVFVIALIFILDAIVLGAIGDTPGVIGILIMLGIFTVVNGLICFLSYRAYKRLYNDMREEGIQNNGQYGVQNPSSTQYVQAPSSYPSTSQTPLPVYNKNGYETAV